jgi:hypothetical protein
MIPILAVVVILLLVATGLGAIIAIGLWLDTDYDDSFIGCFASVFLVPFRPILRKPSADAPRWQHHFYADAHAYFWISCPMCGKKFGGHEDGSGCLMDNPGGGLSVCGRCSAEANKRNTELLSHYHVEGEPPGAYRWVLNDE